MQITLSFTLYGILSILVLIAQFTIAVVTTIAYFNDSSRKLVTIIFALIPALLSIVLALSVLIWK